MDRSIVLALSERLKAEPEPLLKSVGERLDQAKDTDAIKNANAATFMDRVKQYVREEAEQDAPHQAVNTFVERIELHLLRILQAENRGPGWLSPMILRGVGLFALSVAVMAGIWWVVSTQIGPGGGLEDTETARGIISFIFATGTMAIAFILIVALFTRVGDYDEKRFEMGKEILTALIAVLATILGFYFGSAESATASTTLPTEPAGTVQDAG